MEGASDISGAAAGLTGHVLARTQEVEFGVDLGQLARVAAQRSFLARIGRFLAGFRARNRMSGAVGYDPGRWAPGPTHGLSPAGDGREEIRGGRPRSGVALESDSGSRSASWRAGDTCRSWSCCGPHGRGDVNGRGAQESSLGRHGDLYTICATTQRDGVDFNLAFIPPTFDAPHPEDFDTDYMRALYKEAYDEAAHGYRWHKLPPGY